MDSSTEETTGIAFGASLRAARERYKLTLREVQERSEALAKKYGRREFAISASWLNRIETGVAGVTATKLVMLTNIYGLSIDETVAIALGTPLASESGEDDIPTLPNATLLLTRGPLLEYANYAIADEVIESEPPLQTELLSRSEKSSDRLRRAVVGKQDNTMRPMIQPGSVLVVDTRRKAIPQRAEWTHEFDRPIFFLMAREGYFTGFVELDQQGKWLTLVPHALSYQTNRRWRYRHEVEVIGEVVGFTSRRY